MKPRLTLLSAWYDCGWRYEQWRCTDGRFSAIEGSPATAYYSWKRMAGK